MPAEVVFSLWAQPGGVARAVLHLKHGPLLGGRSRFLPALVARSFRCPLSALQVLVLGNKRDLTGALDEKELIEKM